MDRDNPAPDVSAWHSISVGAGRPLVLLHGIGMSSAVWDPVVPLLARSRRVIAIDLPGFGQSPPLPPEVKPTVDNIGLALKEFLAFSGIREPVDMAGNSLGGQLALCAARDGFARSVTAFSPAGLWRVTNGPARTHFLLKMTRASSRRLPRLSHYLLGKPWGRKLAMGLTVSPGADRIPAEVARAMAVEFARNQSFEITINSNAGFEGGRHIEVPVTVAFGKRDWLLREDSRYRDQLPAHTRWLVPEGWGHVPMWDDPESVAALILETAG